MALFLLEDALSQDSGAGVATDSDFMRYILETKIPGIHFHHVDDVVGSSEATTAQTSGAESSTPPRLVSGAHEDHMIPRLCQEEWASNNAVLKILRDQENVSSTSKGNHAGKPNVEIFHSKSLDYLERNWSSLMENLNDVQRNRSMLLSIADNLEALPPPNPPLPWDVLNMAKWKDSLCELIKEMKTVEENCSPSLLCTPRVYVLTSTPYSAFLTALAVEIDDKESAQKSDAT